MRKICLFISINLLASCALTPTVPDGEKIFVHKNHPVGGEVIYSIDGTDKEKRYRRKKTLERISKICSPNLYYIEEENVCSTEKGGEKIKLFGKNVRQIRFKCKVQ